MTNIHSINSLPVKNNDSSLIEGASMPDNYRPKKFEIPLQEIQFEASRSGGPGGQNVNKVNSKVVLRFDVAASKYLSAENKTALLRKSTRVNSNGEIVLYCSSTRSQVSNKEKAVEILNHHINQILRKKKARIPTKPSKATLERRAQEKKRLSVKKAQRKIVGENE